MTREQLDALFAMKAAFPNMDWNIGADNVMRVQVWLTEPEAKFMLDAQQMMTPR